MERLPPDEVALVRSAAEALAARGGKGRTTAKQELALAAALAILAGRWRYHPEKEHVALACKAYGAGKNQVNDYRKHLQLDRLMAWRASQGHPERGEPKVSPSTSFPTHPYATLTRPAMHCAVSRDVAPDNSCWFAAIANEAGGGQTALSVRRTLVGMWGVAECARPQSADSQRHAVCRRGRGHPPRS